MNSSTDSSTPSHDEVGDCNNKLHEKEDGKTDDTSNAASTHPPWLRPDCLEFYNIKLQCSQSTSSGSRWEGTGRITRCRERVGLLRAGINRAMDVKKRHPNAQFLEFGVHEGKDIVRMASFLRSIEEQKHKSLLKALSKSKSKSKGGKANGNSRSRNNNMDGDAFLYSTFHGFDSFEGLPEDWNNGQVGADNNHFHKQGAFDTGGELPDVDNLVNSDCLKLGAHGRGNNNTNIMTTVGGAANSDLPSSAATAAAPPPTTICDNITFHKGWFHNTLPPFLNTTHPNTPIAFIHADADLYSSTLTFLHPICSRKLLRAGSVIIFDEFWNYPNWQEGEYKAWNEIVNEFELEGKYEYFGFHAPSGKEKRYKHYGYQSVGVVFTSDI